MKFLSRLQVPGPTSLDDAANKRYVDSVGEGGGPHALTHIDDEGDRIPNVEPYIDEQNPGAPGLMSAMDKNHLNNLYEDITDADYKVVPETIVRRNEDGDFRIRSIGIDVLDSEILEEIMSEYIDDIDDFGDWMADTDGIKDILNFLTNVPGGYALPTDAWTFFNYFILLLYMITEQGVPAYAPPIKGARLWRNTNQTIESQAGDLDSLIVFNEIIYDKTDFFNPQLPIGFVVPENGLYSIRGGVLFKAEETGRVDLGLVVGEMVDGMPTLKQIENSEIKYVGANESNTVQVSSTCALNEGDIVGMAIVNMTNDDVTVYTEAHNSPSITITKLGKL